VAAALLLEVRLLAAWLPPGGAGSLRALAAWFELANVEDRLAYLSGGPLPAPFELGALSSAWDTLAPAQSAEELRTLLAASSWGDPGGARAADVHLATRFAWARRVIDELPEARAWAAGAAALLLAGELLVARRAIEPALVRGTGVGGRWPGAETPAELRARLPGPAGWALADVKEPAELWRAEGAWWRTVEADARQMVRSQAAGREIVVGAVALLALDALRVATALAVAAQRGATPAREVLDALC
jgi:hypothetical protein